MTCFYIHVSHINPMFQVLSLLSKLRQSLVADRLLMVNGDLDPSFIDGIFSRLC